MSNHGIDTKSFHVDNVVTELNRLEQGGFAINSITNTPQGDVQIAYQKSTDSRRWEMRDVKQEELGSVLHGLFEQGCRIRATLPNPKNPGNFHVYYSAPSALLQRMRTGSQELQRAGGGK